MPQTRASLPWEESALSLADEKPRAQGRVKVGEQGRTLPPNSGNARPPAASHIAIFLKSLGGGGMQASMMRLAGALAARGHKIDLVVAGKLKGPGLERVPPGVRLIPLPRSHLPWWPLWRALRTDGRSMGNGIPLPATPPRAAYFISPLARYLKRKQPDALIAGGTLWNLAALWARRQAGVSTRIVVSEHNPLSAVISASEGRCDWRWQHAEQLVKRAYPSADSIVSVSHGVANDLAEFTGLPNEAITTIYNAVIDDALIKKAEEPIDHPWFAPNMSPVVLGVGRLQPQKNFPTLMRAFAKLRAGREAKLVILGGDDQDGVHANLISLANNLGIADDVEMLGFVDNPFAYMARADALVLSSSYEGLPTVLIEAMACGCPVISTRCPHGPEEILGGGRYGPLVPVGDDEALTEMIAATLDRPPDRNRLRARAEEFDLTHAAERYLALL